MFFLIMLEAKIAVAKISGLGVFPLPKDAYRKVVFRKQVSLLGPNFARRREVIHVSVFRKANIHYLCLKDNAIEILGNQR